MQKRWNIGIVVQRYGLEVNGGAELAARWLAEQLHTFCDVTVLTTCAIDFYTWADEYPAGETEINGVCVQRYRVDKPRNWRKERNKSGRLTYEAHTLFEEIEWVRDQGPMSNALLNALDAQRDQFDAVIFFTYVYATSYFGLQIVPEKAILVSAAHEEAFLKFPVFRSTFNAARAIVYLTRSERNHVQCVLRNRHVPSVIAGIGVDAPSDVQPQRFRDKFAIDGDFLFYVGRIDVAKNVPQLFDYFLQYVNRPTETDPSTLKLILAGKSHIDIPDHPHIQHIGFISDQDKFDGMAAATVCMMPSEFESLSILALESWLMQTPTLVNGNCHVLKDQTRLSNGGLYYHEYREFERTLDYLLANSAERDRMGQRGKRFVETNYTAQHILAAYQQLFEMIASS